MKIYDLIVRGKREMDISIEDRSHKFEITVGNRRKFDLIAENLQNRLKMYIHHTLRLSENPQGLYVYQGRQTSAPHVLRINASDIDVYLNKKISTEDNSLHLVSKVSAFFKKDVSLEENTLRMDCEVSITASRPRLLADVDPVSLGEIDDMTFEELDYLKL